MRPTGQRVEIPFPSGRPNRERLSRALVFLQETTELELACPLLGQPQRWMSEPAYLCGTDEERARELVELWSAPEPPVVWCGRGGYGATRLLDRLETLLPQAPPRPGTRLLGYSDITALFAFIRTHDLPIECVHAPVLTEAPDHPHPRQLHDALRGAAAPLPVTNATSEFSGPIWGGNLAVLASLCGTRWLPEISDGAILLEDVDETPYRLDRFITQLHDSGFFRSSQGVFLGQFTRCGDDGAGLLVVKQRLAELDIVCLGELPVGHEAEHVPVFFSRNYCLEPQEGVLQPQSPRPLSTGL